VVNTKSCGIIKCIKVDIIVDNIYYDKMKKVLLCSILVLSNYAIADEIRIDIKPNEYILYSNEKLSVDPDCVKNNFQDFPIKLKNKDNITIKELMVDNQSTKIKRLLTDKNSIFYINNGIAYVKNPDFKNKEILISHGIYRGDKLNQKWNLWAYSFDSKNIKECLKKVEVKKEDPKKPEKLKEDTPPAPLPIKKQAEVKPSEVQVQPVPKEEPKIPTVQKPEIVKPVEIISNKHVEPKPIIKEEPKALVSKPIEVKPLPVITNPTSSKELKNTPSITNDALKIFKNNGAKQDGQPKEVKKEVPPVVKIVGSDKKEPEVSKKEKELPKEKVVDEKKSKHASNVANKIKLPQQMRYCVLEETERLVNEKFPNYEMTEFEKDPKFQEHMDESIIKALETCSKKK
jgi:hypothetical protein